MFCRNFQKQSCENKSVKNSLDDHFMNISLVNKTADTLHKNLVLCSHVLLPINLSIPARNIPIPVQITFVS